MTIEFRQQPDGVAAHEGRGLDALEMICETLVWGKAGEADVHARFLRVTPRIGQADRPQSRNDRFQEDHVNVVMVQGRLDGVSPYRTFATKDASPHRRNLQSRFAL